MDVNFLACSCLNLCSKWGIYYKTRGGARCFKRRTQKHGYPHMQPLRSSFLVSTQVDGIPDQQTGNSHQVLRHYQISFGHHCEIGIPENKTGPMLLHTVIKALYKNKFLFPKPNVSSKPCFPTYTKLVTL